MNAVEGRMLAFVMLLALAPPQEETEVATGEARACTVYDPDPDHPWNRVHAALWDQSTELGFDDLDGFLTVKDGADPDPSRTKVKLAVIDRLLAQPGELRSAAPLRRALLSRDVWAVLDRTDLVREPALKRRLLELLAALALDGAAISRLPDNLADAVAAGVEGLPAELADQDGVFVALEERPCGTGPLAGNHDFLTGSRSAFIVLLRLPDGRDATIDYLARLRATTPPLVAAKSAREDAPRWTLSPEFPQLPVGTEVALVRRALLVDAEGRVVGSPITESVELRRFLDVTKSFDEGGIVGDLKGVQDVSEFALSRGELLAGRRGGLRRIAPDERTLGLFSVHSDGVGVQMLKMCGACHAERGIYSVNSFTGFLSGPGTASLNQTSRVRALFPSTGEDVVRTAIAAKEASASFGELRALWPRGR